MKTSVLLWIFGLLVTLTLGGYAYTRTVDAECVKRDQYHSDIAWIRSALQELVKSECSAEETR